MTRFAIASLTPAALIALACIFGAPFALPALLSITVVVFFLDKLTPESPPRTGTGRALSIALALVHFPLLYAGIRALATEGHLALSDKALLFVALGLFAGQVSNSNAHELIHAAARLPRRLGAAVYISLLYGHHVSAHLRVHHVHAATDADPNSAQMGEGFWTYALRVAAGEFAEGWRAETAQRRRATRAPGLHPFTFYVAGAVVALTLSFVIAGLPGLAAHLGIAAYAQLQLMLSDYVQHYGLRRHRDASGRAEPVGPQHSWNAPHWYSGAMMLNAPRHSDHHLHPGRAFPALENSPDTMPQLPRSLPVMAVIALVPPLWRRIMDPRAARWRKSA